MIKVKKKKRKKTDLVFLNSIETKRAPPLRGKVLVESGSPIALDVGSLWVYQLRWATSSKTGVTLLVKEVQYKSYGSL